MSGKTVPTVALGESAGVRAQDFEIRVVPLKDGGRVMILSVGGAEHTLRLDDEGRATLRDLLSDGPGEG